MAECLWRRLGEVTYKNLQLFQAPWSGKCIIATGSCVPRHFRQFTTPTKEKDYYAILKISPHATQAQIKDSYYKLSMKYHPDHNKGSLEAHQKFTDITEAYSVLGKYDVRRRYDKGVFHKDQDSSTVSSSPAKHSRPPVHTKAAKFNFDEFYRMHYSEALRRHQKQTQDRKVAKERAEQLTVPSHVQRLLIISVAMSIFLGGWYLAHFRNHNRTDQKL